MLSAYLKEGQGKMTALGLSPGVLPEVKKNLTVKKSANEIVKLNRKIWTK